MPGLTVRVILEDIKKVETEALVVGFFQDVRPLKGFAGQLDWLLCGALSGLLLKNKLQRFARRRGLAHVTGKGSGAKDIHGRLGAENGLLRIVAPHSSQDGCG